MEAITGFTGILVFTGQSIEGIVQLRAFFKDVSLAPRRSAALLDEMENLTGTLSDIQQLVASLEDTPKETLNTGASFNTSILQSNLKSCADDVAVWVKHTRNADPREEKGIKAFFRRVKVAANTKGFEELGRKIPSHQQRIGISLSVLGRSLDHAGIKRLDELSTKFMGLTEAHLKLNDSINTNIAARSECLPADGTLSELLPRELQPLNLMEGHLERMSTNHSESHRSIQSISQSLSSLASHVSQLMKTHLGELSRISSAEELPDIKKAPNEIECCCDALSGIDDAFQVYKLGKQVVQNTCVYCGTIFSLEGGSDLAYRRGRHLTDPHSFGSCNLAVTYESWEELKAHLCAYHNLKEQNAMDIRRFERKRRPLISLSRSEDERNSVQTSTKEEQPNEHMIHQARLELLLRQSFDEKIPTFRFPLEICISIAFQYLDEAAFQTATDLSTNCSKQRDEIICAIEGVIVSGNDVDHSFCAKSWKKDFILDLEQSAQDLRILKDRKRKKRKVYDGRDRINEWFFEILKDSRTLISLLRGGKITTEMPPAISPEWVFSVLEFWDVDDAATGLGPHCESSDGAVDSRDDLGNETQSTKSFERNGITIRKYFGIALDEKVLEALDDPTDQAFLLKLEQDMIQFVECSQEPFIDLPPCKPFFRMLTLKLAEYFLLTQQVDAVAGNVRIFRTSICNVPRPLTTIAEKRKPFLRANSDGDVDPDCKPANATSIAGIKYNPFFVEGEVLSREEREAAYRRARERVFGKDGLIGDITHEPHRVGKNADANYALIDGKCSAWDGIQTNRLLYGQRPTW